MAKITIIPAILTADQFDFERKLVMVARLATAVHIDVADGRFVANRTLPLEAMLTPVVNLTREYHLMVADPAAVVLDTPFGSADRIVIHAETLDDPSVLVSWSQRLGDRFSLAINPSTPLDRWTDALRGLGRVQVMGVEPGQQGAPFLSQTIDRVQQLRAANPDLEITVDGGVSRDNIAQLAAVGANRLVVGSAIWQTPDPVSAYQELAKEIE